MHRVSTISVRLCHGQFPLTQKGLNVVNAALEAVSFEIRPSLEVERMTEEHPISVDSTRVAQQRVRHKTAHNKESARGYAYNLIKGIIEKNPNLGFKGLCDVFGGYKTYIKEKDKVKEKDKIRWFMDAEDVIKIADGTQVVVSTQWGLRNGCKEKMERLLKIASNYGLDITSP